MVGHTKMDFKKRFEMEEMTREVIGQKGIYVFFQIMLPEYFSCRNGKVAKTTLTSSGYVYYLGEKQVIRDFRGGEEDNFALIKINQKASLDITYRSGDFSNATLLFYSDQSRYNKYYVFDESYENNLPGLIEVDFTGTTPKMTVLKTPPATLHMPQISDSSNGEESIVATRNGFMRMPKGLGIRVIKCNKTQKVYYMRYYFVNDNFEESHSPNGDYIQIHLIDPQTNQGKRVLLDWPGPLSQLSSVELYGRFLYVLFASYRLCDNAPFYIENYCSIFAVDLIQIEPEKNESDDPFGDFREINHKSEYSTILWENRLIRGGLCLPGSVWNLLDKEMIAIHRGNCVYSLDYFEVRQGRLHELPRQIQTEISTFLSCLRKKPGLPREIVYYILSFLI